MISKLLKNLFPKHTVTTIKVDKFTISQFVLSYKELMIGKLSFNEDTWTFEYTDSFKKQSELAVLLEFPDVSKTYKSETLWPFFANRIPSFKQTKMQELIKSNPDIKTNLPKLLAEFGVKSTNNPYLLHTNLSL